MIWDYYGCVQGREAINVMAKWGGHMDGTLEWEKWFERKALEGC